MSPISSAVGRAGAEGDADRRRHHAVDAVGAAIGDHPHARRGAGAYHSTSRIGIDDDTTSVAAVGQGGDDVAGHAGLGRLGVARRAPPSMAACARASARGQRATHGVPWPPCEALVEGGAQRGGVGRDHAAAAVCSGSIQVPAAVDLHLARPGGRPATG